MADASRVALNFDLGFQSDVARDSLPQGAAYRMKDWIPQLDAPLRQRGGWQYATRDVNALSAAISMSGVGWAPFAGDGHLIFISEAGKVFNAKQFDGTTGSFIAATHGQKMTHRPFWHRDRMIIPAQLGGAAANPYKYYDSGGAVYTTAAIGGTPPQARVGWSWGDYLVLANYYDPSAGGALKNNRMAFSAVGNPDSWTLSGASGSVIDAPREIVAGLPLRSVFLVWGYQDTWMYTGDTPPPGGNLARVNLFVGNGCMDGRTVASYRDYAIWANNSGVWQTDGATLTDLTKKGGVSNFYRALVGGFNFQQGWSAAGDVIRGFYFLTIRNAAGALLTTLVCDLDREVWFECQNINATMFASRPSSPGTVLADGHEELFFASASAPRAGLLSTLWTPSLTYAADGDGTIVLPVLETPYYKLGTDSLKRIRRGYFDYDLRTGGGAPTINVEKMTDPNGAYEQAGVLATTTKKKRAPVPVNRPALGIAFRLTRIGASADARLYDIDLEGHGWEASR